MNSLKEEIDKNQNEGGQFWFVENVGERENEIV